MAGARICLGQIGAPHGVRGEIRLHSFTAEPTAIATYGPLESEDGRIFKIESMRQAKHSFVAKLSGIDDRNAAERLANTKLYVPRERLPEPAEPDEFYHADLIGLRAVDYAGRECGTVVAVHNFGAGDLIELKPPGRAQTELLPFDAATVPQVDLANGCLVVVHPTATSEMPPPLRGRPTAKRSGGR